MPYRIVLSKSVIKELDGLTPKIHDRVIEHLRKIEENPRMVGAEKLTAINAYKFRVGSFRIIFQIDDTENEVRVVMVEDRKQVYKRLRGKK